MRGGRSFSSRGSTSTRGGRGGGYRGNSSTSYRDRPSSRYEGNHNGRSGYSGGGNSGHYNSSSADTGGRNRYQGSSRSSHDSKRSYNDSYSRDRDSPVRKRSRHEGGGGGSGSRRDFSSSSERGRFDNHHPHHNNAGGSSSHRPKMRSPPVTSSRSPFRGGRASNVQRAKDNMGPPTRLPPRKFAGGIRSRAPPPVGRRPRIVPARAPPARATIVRRRREQDNVRRAKIANLRSSIKKRTVAEKADEEDDADKKTDENGDKSADEGDVQKKKVVSSKSRPKKKVSTSANGDNGDEAAADIDMDVTAGDGDDDDQAEGDAQQPDSDNDDEQENGDEGTRKERIAKKDAPEKEEVSRTRKKYIKLNCMHCKKHCVTFQEYNNHLHSRQHRLALRRISVDQKAKVLKMRFVQRQAQREVDGDTKASTAETSFCTLCRLNYRSPKTEHQASNEHREMKKFLMPYCDICRSGFKNPMDYEVHRCSLEHIKAAHRKGVSPKKALEENDDDDELQVNLGEFTTVDSVGDIDYVPIINDLDEKEEIADNGTASKANVLVGSEHVKKVEALYCEICHYFLPKHKDSEQALKKHCNVRTHLRNYLRFKEDETLRLAAEKVHRRHQEETNATKDDKEGEKAEPAVTAEDGVDDKIWEEDVEKDSADLLHTANEDEDEDSTTTTERYDRFKNTGKGNDSDAEKIDESVEEIKKDEPIDDAKE